MVSACFCCPDHFMHTTPAVTVIRAIRSEQAGGRKIAYVSVWKLRVFCRTSKHALTQKRKPSRKGRFDNFPHPYGCTAPAEGIRQVVRESGPQPLAA